MDTDYLSNEAFNLILIAARFDDALKVIMGSSCSQYDEEDECLKGFLEIFDEIEKAPEEYFEEWDIHEVNVQDYKKKLFELKMETLKVTKMDKNQKHFVQW